MMEIGEGRLNGYSVLSDGSLVKSETVEKKK